MTSQDGHGLWQNWKSCISLDWFEEIGPKFVYFLVVTQITQNVITKERDDKWKSCKSHSLLFYLFLQLQS